MNKETILDHFKDINHAYNDCTKYDTLKNMLDELQESILDKVRDDIVHLHDWAFDREGILRIIDKYKADPVEFAEKVIGLKLLDFQKKFLTGMDYMTDDRCKECKMDWTKCGKCPVMMEWVKEKKENG